MAEITIYTTAYCPYCIRAKQLLERKGAAYREIDVGRDPGLRAEMQHRSQQRTVPQIWIGTRHIGGCDDLYALERAGRLDPLLAQPDH